MSRTKLGLLIFLFAFNSISLYLYLSSHHDHSPHSPPSENHQSLTGNGHTLTDNPHNFSLSKPWPILPSYLPWSLNPNVPFRSCESYFGNGFTRRIDLLKSSLSDHRTGGWFRCFYSETLRSSICEGGRVRMHPDKIRMSIGGERLEAVMGRGEDEELPVFESGAFDVEVVDRSSHGRKLVDDEFLNQYVQFGADSQHTMRGLVDSVKLVGASDFQCSEFIGLQMFTSDEKSYEEEDEVVVHSISVMIVKLSCQGQRLDLKQTWSSTLDLEESERSAGHVDKYYMGPGDQHCRSKKEVLQYINQMNRATKFGFGKNQV